MFKQNLSRPSTWAFLYAGTIIGFGLTHYLLQGLSRQVSFWEALYFSTVTITTLGYGDIAPCDSSALFLAASEALLGVIILGLFLFRLTTNLAIGVRQDERKIGLRQKWKPIFQEHIRENFSKDLRSDIIIRDVSRVDEYPDFIDDEKGISSWFRLGLAGLYHRGLLVGFGWHELVELEEGKYRVLDSLGLDKDDEEIKTRAIKVMKIGMIPFENIEEVDFEGDEYYGYPHIYCHFANNGQPYERIAFFTKDQLFENSLPFYSEVVSAEDVRRASISAGILKPYI